jgi:hypothetical protein
MSPTNAMAGALPVESVRYVSREWDFSLEHPANWKVDFENQADPPYMLPVGLLGPQGLRGNPALTIQANLVTDSGLSLDGYMNKAEGELRGYFPGLQTIRKWEEPLLESPTAWLSYTYMGNSGAPGTQRDSLHRQGPSALASIHRRDRPRERAKGYAGPGGHDPQPDARPDWHPRPKRLPGRRPGLRSVRHALPAQRQSKRGLQPLARNDGDLQRVS